MDWLALVRQIVAVLLAVWAGRNGQVVANPLTDWQVLLPAAGAAGAIGWNGIGNWFKAAGVKDVLRLVSAIIPYQEKAVPRELMNVLLDVMAWRFKSNGEAVKLVDQLVQFDMQMAREGSLPAHPDNAETTKQIGDLQTAVSALIKQLEVKSA